VYVLQQGYAYWKYAPLPAFGPAIQGLSQPSLQNTSFSPRHKPHIYLAQAQPANGTADDGLGDAQVVTSGPQQATIGTSKGYKIVLCHPGTGGTLTVPAVTLIGSGTTQYYEAGWSYNCQVMTLQMTRNSVDITNPNKPEVPVMVGEPNQMGVSLSPVPQDIAPPTFQWTIPGDKIKDYIETAGNPTAVPPLPFTGRKVELPASDLTTQSPHFYWYNGTFAGDSKEVSVVVTFAGKPITIKGKCKVYRPRMDKFTGTYVTPLPPHATDALVGESDTGVIKFSPHNEGVSFYVTVTAPNIPVAQGQIALLQKASSINIKTKGVEAGTPFYEGLTASNALDSSDNDPIYGTQPGGSPYDTHTTMIPGGSATTSGSDTPDANVRAAVDHLDFSESFTMYLVYQPSTPNSIQVVLGKVDWGWTVKANRTSALGSWNITSYTPQTPGNITPDNVDEHELPVWDTRLQDVPMSTIPVW